MTNYAAQLSEVWVDGNIVDIAAEMTNLTLRIAGTTLFDVDMINEASELGQALSTALRHLMRNTVLPLYLPLIVPTARNLRLRRALQ